MLASPFVILRGSLGISPSRTYWPVRVPYSSAASQCRKLTNVVTGTATDVAVQLLAGNGGSLEDRKRVPPAAAAWKSHRPLLRI